MYMEKTTFQNNQLYVLVIALDKIERNILILKENMIGTLVYQIHQVIQDKNSNIFNKYMLKKNKFNISLKFRYLLNSKIF